MSIVGAYIKAVREHLVVLLTGSILAAAFTWLPPAFELPPLPTWVVFATLVATLLLASFRAWRDQYRIASSLTEARLACATSAFGAGRHTENTLVLTYEILLTNRTPTPMVIDRFALELAPEEHLRPPKAIKTVVRTHDNQSLPLPVHIAAHSATPRPIRLESYVYLHEPLPPALPYKNSGVLVVRDQVTGTSFKGALRRRTDVVIMMPVQEPTADAEA